MYKAGSTAVEYVHGSFDPATRGLKLAGYKKDDPNNIVIFDRYSMTLAVDNSSMSGKSRNGNLSLQR